MTFQFVRKPGRDKMQAVIRLENNVFEQVLAVARENQCTIKEAASRLIEAGLLAYQKDKAQKSDTIM